MSTTAKTTVGDTPWRAEGRQLMIRDKDGLGVAVPACNGFPMARQLQIRDFIVKAANAFDDLVAACEAAIRYDESICGRAARGNFDLREAGAGIATGEDLDELYFDWIDKARDALAKARA